MEIRIIGIIIYAVILIGCGMYAMIVTDMKDEDIYDQIIKKYKEDGSK